MLLKKALLLIILKTVVTTTTFAQLNLVSNQNIDFSNAITTKKSGNWTDASVWGNNQVPDANTDVIISDNHIVYIDKQAASSQQIVDLCKNLKIEQTAILQMGHNQANFQKDLRINGSILCNGTFSSGRNQPSGAGDGVIYDYNSRIFINLTQDETYISGSGFFNPRSLSIASDLENKNLTIDIYNLITDDNFAIKSSKRVNVTISEYAYVLIKKVLGVTGSTYQFSSPTGKADLVIQGIVIANDVSLFTKNTTANESSSITIESKGSLYIQKINDGVLDRKSELGSFNLVIKNGALLRLGKGISFDNLTNNNPNFTIENSGEVRKHYSETIPTKNQITNAINQFDPNLGKEVSQIKDIFGATHISGWYNFTDRPYLLEGLDKYKEFGATSIKTTLTSINGKMKSAYPFNHTWQNFQTLKEVAQDKFMDSLFNRKHIKTHTFWTTSKNKGDWKKGPDFDHESYLNEEQQFYDLTKHLLETYGDEDKKFIYQNWEGDWMLRGQGILWEQDKNLIPDDVFWTLEGMSRLFRARQRGTERARKEFTSVSAKVLHSIEFNKLWWSDNGTRKTMMDDNIPSVLGDVIPKTRLDLSSWSAYDGGWTNSENPHGHAMWKGIEIASYFTTETNQLTTAHPVQIGEFAINENPPYNGNNSEQVVKNRYGRYIGLSLALSIPNFYLWNLYCSGQQGAPAGFTWEKDVQYETDFLYEWMDGKWIVEPDGSWGFAAEFLRDQWKSTLSTDSFTVDENNITVFPNPSNGTFFIIGLNNNDKVTILDSKGNIVKNITYKSTIEPINLTRLSKGLYFILINQNQSIITKKIIIN
ncbi:T9SS type A sorting domain-containing protein [Polaribacter sp.]|uniref:T9SS type A sorting domain-containing protein n=1 Tax=Polaribacter sp. TaxID=1920175 RepID=UPI003F69F8BF